MESVKGNEHI